MKEKIIELIKQVVGADALIELSIPDEPSFGHFSTNVAMRLAKLEEKKPLALAQEIADGLLAKTPAGFFEKVEAVAPGFVNVWITKEAIHEYFASIVNDELYGRGKSLAGQTVMVEFTDPNPFKLFHIGHLMSNTIGESFARLYEAEGATVIRANYQGDVGLHVAKAIWGMEANKEKMPAEDADPIAKMEYLGEAYAAGSKAYEEQVEAQHLITMINEAVYSRTQQPVNDLYDKGRTWSLDYFETVYARLGTKFDVYFFENEMAKEGLAFIASHEDVFEKSNGALVFKGENYGLHTRVFVNSKGLPTYEAKELGLNKTKFEKYPLDKSVIVTGNEIVDYFKVLLKVMELTIPNVAERTQHKPHGMLRLPSGKMSSRTGDVITAESLLDQVKTSLLEKVSERSALNNDERAHATEVLAIGAIKYSILKQNPGQDIIFDFEKSLSFEGDSGPYLHYTYARLRNIIRKAHDELNIDVSGNQNDFALCDSEVELVLMRTIFDFPDVVRRSSELLTPSGVAVYLHKLAATANKFYELTPILKDENSARRDARLVLVAKAADVVRTGLNLLGVQTLEQI